MPAKADKGHRLRKTDYATDAARTEFGDRFEIECLRISKIPSTPDGKGTQLYRVDAECGWAEVIIATDLYEHIAVAIAFALSAMYEGCPVMREGQQL
jgi:hypothetical protein